MIITPDLKVYAKRSNRTFMELKSAIAAINPDGFTVSSNRTFMELKFR